MEHDEQAERMEREADRMEDESERVGERIDDTRREWEAKEQDPGVPGAQPEAAETPREESDQLPEEGPSEQVHDDTEDDEAKPSPGVPGEEETATGNPDAAGAEED